MVVLTRRHQNLVADNFLGHNSSAVKRLTGNFELIFTMSKFGHHIRVAAYTFSSVVSCRAIGCPRVILRYSFMLNCDLDGFNA